MDAALSYRGEIRIGFAGWSYPDWNGVFYPKPRPRGFRELAFIAQFFTVSEINSSFYRPPRAEWVQRWIDQVRHCPNFQFTAKLWRGFTHERNAGSEDEKAFREGLSPLVEQKRLGAVLLQFPWSFKNTEDRREYLADLIQRFGDYPLVVEVRHGSWNELEVFAWLREQGVGICNIDQPLIGKSLRPSAHATSAIGYVRVHGRNAEHWFAKNKGVSERYDYLYSLEELEPWAERIRSIAQKADVVYVIANNHPDAKSVVNAFQLENLISGKPVLAPAALIERYPVLAGISSPAAPAGSQDGKVARQNRENRLF
ncbi:MAG TPA: DUF72 domain-containing protein [Terriglobia bacterium]|nr:DUF72 domain-containing protein [Terriglobia bacterium]